MRGNVALRLIQVAIVGMVIFLILTVSGLANPITSGTGQVARPILERLTNFSYLLKRTAAAPFKTRDESNIIQKLESQIRALTYENARLLELERENAELRRELSFIENIKFPATIARVIGRLKEGGAEFIILNRGTADGIQTGAAVIAEGVILGKIVRAQKSVSIAAPLWVSGNKTAATFAGNEKTAGIVEGELNVNMKMSFIPKDLTLSEGMLVITSGLEEKIPRGLVIGRVARIESNQQELFQTVYLEPAADPTEITIISILQPNEVQ